MSIGCDRQGVCGFSPIVISGEIVGPSTFCTDAVGQGRENVEECYWSWVRVEKLEDGQTRINILDIRE